jgi:hypothetical protein
MRPLFCILNVLGDMLVAKARVQALSKLWPGEYVIYDATTGERVSIGPGDEEA